MSPQQKADKKQFQISDDYKEVAERIDDLYDKFPHAVLRGSWDLQVMGEFAYIIYTAECVREPGEEPCIGTAMEQIPGTTPYTRGSEIQNAETSAWGRAIVAAGASRSKRIASADEIRSADARREADTRAAETLAPKPWRDRIKAALDAIEPKTKRAAVKHNFAANFGEPKDLTVSQVANVEEALRSNEIPIPDPAATDGGAQSTDAPPAAGDDPENPRGTGAEADGGSSGSDAGEAGRVVGSSAAAPPASTSKPPKPSTPQQRQTLGIRFKELVDGEFLGENAKDEIVASLTGGRTTTRTELTFDEAVKLIALTHMIAAGNVTVTVGNPEVALLAPNNAIGDKFMESWPTAEVPA